MDLTIVEKKDKIYLIESKIKSIEGKLNLILEGQDIGESQIDLDLQKKALTNLLEML